MVQYLIYIIIFQILFLISYDLFHKKDTFFSLNRGYLIFTSILSLILPFIKIESIRENLPQEYVVNLPAIIIGQRPTTITNPDIVHSAGTSLSLETINWWLLIYLAGVIVTFFLFIQKNIKLYILRKQSTRGIINGYNLIIVPNSKDAFSFWNTIYLGDQIIASEKEQIITHEVVHLNEKHSIDLLWFELLKIVLWFNPLVYIYQSRINTLHEFIADAKSVNVLGKRRYYEQLLNTVFDTEKIEFINQFFDQSLLKTRIQMLQKSKSKEIVKFKYLTLLPILILMIVFSSFSEKEKNLSTSNSDIQEQLNNTSDSILKTNTGDTEKLSTNLEMISKSSNANKTEVPFDKVHKVPTTESCKTLTDSQEIRKCVSKEIEGFVNKNFNTSEMRKYAQPETNRIFVRFKIDITGTITDINARASAPELKQEAVRVVSLLPKMVPGEMANGQKVDVLYTLPIIFYNTITKENKSKTKTVAVTTDKVISETIPEEFDHNIESGYYLITNIFKSKSRFEKTIKNLKKVGLPAQGFKNPVDGYFYLHLGKYQELHQAKELIANNINGRYSGDIYIMKINGK